MSATDTYMGRPDLLNRAPKDYEFVGYLPKDSATELFRYALALETKVAQAIDEQERLRRLSYDYRALAESRLQNIQSLAKQTDQARADADRLADALEDVGVLQRMRHVIGSVERVLAAYREGRVEADAPCP